MVLYFLAFCHIYLCIHIVSYYFLEDRLISRSEGFVTNSQNVEKQNLLWLTWHDSVKQHYNWIPSDTIATWFLYSVYVNSHSKRNCDIILCLAFSQHNDCQLPPFHRCVKISLFLLLCNGVLCIYAAFSVVVSYWTSVWFHDFAIVNWVGTNMFHLLISLSLSFFCIYPQEWDSWVLW